MQPEGSKAGNRAGSHVLWVEAEGTWAACSGEEEDRRWPHCFKQIPEEGKQKEVLDSAPENPWQDGNDADLHWECSDKTLGNIFFFFYHESGQTLEQASW